MAKRVRGGEKFKKLIKNLKKSKGLIISAGFFPSSRYPNGTSVAFVAAIQEFGAPAAGIPSRPFFRNAIANNKRAWIKGFTYVYAHDPKNAANITGVKMVSDIRASILAIEHPPLKPSTIARKVGKNSKPLVDTGLMLRSVSYEIKKKK